MRRQKARLGVLILALLTLALLQIPGWRSARSSSQSVVLSFQGYTNLPGKTQNFAVVSVHNSNRFPIRWHANWSEHKWDQGYTAIFGAGSPWLMGSLSLAPGDSLLATIEEPIQGIGDNQGTWRFTVQWTRYTPR